MKNHTITDDINWLPPIEDYENESLPDKGKLGDAMRIKGKNLKYPVAIIWTDKYRWTLMSCTDEGLRHGFLGFGVEGYDFDKFIVDYRKCEEIVAKWLLDQRDIYYKSVN